MTPLTCRAGRLCRSDPPGQLQPSPRRLLQSKGRGCVHCRQRCDHIMGRKSFASFNLASAGNSSREDVAARASCLSISQLGAPDVLWWLHCCCSQGWLDKGYPLIYLPWLQTPLPLQWRCTLALGRPGFSSWRCPRLPFKSLSLSEPQFPHLYHKGLILLCLPGGDVCKVIRCDVGRTMVAFIDSPSGRDQSDHLVVGSP